MGGGGNPTWIKYLNERKDDKGLCSCLISNIPRNIWVAVRIKALEKNIKINTVGAKLFEKWANDEIEI